MRRRYVVVEGLIGVGKTTLCKLLERERSATLFLEPAATNPFLEPFYAEPERYAFPVQMFYLINRWRQQDRIRQQDLFNGLVVSDYLMEKDRLFAEKTLPADELELYDRFARALGEHTPTPDLVIFLDAPTDVIMARIARRQAPGEQAIRASYLDDLRSRYRKLLTDWGRCPILRLDNRDMNYADDPDVQARLLSWIDSALETGRLPPEAPGSIVDREDQPSLFGRRTP